jgi:hypothetical protein
MEERESETCACSPVLAPTSRKTTEIRSGLYLPKSLRRLQNEARRVNASSYRRDKKAPILSQGLWPALW